MSAARPRLSVIVDESNETRVNLEATFAALSASTLSREQWELIVVTNVRADAPGSPSAEHADVIVRLGGAWVHGFAYRQNRGAELARGAVLVFLGSDVAVNRETLARIDDVFAADGELAAIVGALDAPRLRADAVTRYVTLYRGWMEQRAAGRADQMSARCGAIRAQAFFDAGCFNEWDDRAAPWIEADFGRRLRARGYRLALHEDVRGTCAQTLRLADLVRPMPRSPSRGEKMTGVLSNTASLCVHMARRGEVWLAFAALPIRVVAALVAGWVMARELLRYRIVGDLRPGPGIEALAEVGVDAWPPVPTRPPT